ncbi:MAG TPA: HEAT repeat domain-containing protein [Candidatus Ozemobacteraceae bacterium]|nr:HEAT repeat domain-containing protein [Candidatus Ozemobacteraceae bacterium]
MQTSTDYKARIARQFGFALKDPNPNIRFIAIEGLQLLPDVPELEGIPALMNDTDRFVRWKATQACGLLGLESSVAALIKFLQSPDFHTRVYAAQSLGLIGTPECLEALTQAARAEGSPKVRQAITATFGHFPSSMPWDLMFRTAHDADVGVRLETAKALGKAVPNEQACQILITMLEQETNNQVFATAVHSLGQFKKSSLVSYFEHCLAHQEPRIRANAIEALGCFPLPTVEKVILPYLNDPANRVKANVVHVFLANNQPGKVEKNLVGLLVSPRQFERASGAWLAGTFRLTDTQPILIKLLSDEEGIVAERAAWALGRIKAPDTFSALQTAYANANQWALAHIIKAMSEVVGAAEAPTIARLMSKEHSPLHRSQFLDILTDLAYTSALSEALKYRSDADHRLRLSAFRFIGLHGGAESRDILFQGLGEPNPKVRALCADLMIRNGDFRALKTLSELLNEQDKMQRLQAAHTLKEMAVLTKRDVAEPSKPG